MKKTISTIMLFLACAGGQITVPQPEAQAIASDELALLRRQIVKACQDSTGAHPGFTKTQINGILNALDEWYHDNLAGSYTGSGRAQMVQCINANQAPLTLTALQKKLIGAYFLRSKIREELGQ